jgi:peroxiredoxin
MKKFFLFSLALMPLAVFAQQNSFTINGQLKNTNENNQWVYLSYAKDGRNSFDSAKVTGGKYVFKGELAEPAPAALFAEKPNPYVQLPKKEYTIIFLEPATITITHVDSFSNTLITGSKANTDYAKLKKQLEPFSNKMQPLIAQYRAAYAQGDTTTVKKLELELNALDSTSREDVYANYVRNNPASPIALFALQNYTPMESFDEKADKIEALFNQLSDANKNTSLGQAIQKRLTATRKTGIGQVAPDFTQNDTLGNPVSLSSFRGKYVLVDFWASWCRPCREENPNVVKAFNRFKDKGFQIIGVSLDRPGAKQQWLEAIHRDGLTWTHVSDLQFWNNAVAKTYGVEGIPQNFLLDPNGKIIAKSLRGEDLEKKLEEIYKD